MYCHGRMTRVCIQFIDQVYSIVAETTHSPFSAHNPKVGNFFLSGPLLGVGDRANRNINDYSCTDLSLFKCDMVTSNLVERTFLQQIN